MSFICSECNKEFDSKLGLAQHKKWHKPGFRENISKKIKEKRKDPTSKYNTTKCKKNPYNHIPEFFFNFLKEHTYFTRKRIIEDYICNNNIPKDEYRSVKLEFGSIIRHQVKIGMLEKYSKKTYKINKDK